MCGFNPRFMKDTPTKEPKTAVTATPDTKQVLERALRQMRFLARVLVPTARSNFPVSTIIDPTLSEPFTSKQSKL